MTNRWIDVHTFDSAWKHSIKTRFTPLEKINLFKYLYFLINRYQKKLDTKILATGMTGLELVVRSRITDPINKIAIDDILAEICVKMDKYKEPEQIDIINNILEQMNDMIITNGTCPQGQSTRLFQIYNSI
jgi:hypothetical protein